MFLETAAFRAVHACWDASNIAYLNNFLDHGRLTLEAIEASFYTDSRLFQALEETLKGKELKMPEGLTFSDKDGNERRELRIKWWDNPAGTTYKNYSVEHLADPLLDQEIDPENQLNLTHYSPGEKPVFFGHYWLQGIPAPYRHNVCCLDYSVAKGGNLVAYRWDGEKDLQVAKLVCVPTKSEHA